MSNILKFFGWVQPPFPTHLNISSGDGSGESETESSELTFVERVAMYRAKKVERATTDNPLAKQFVQTAVDRLAQESAKTDSPNFFFRLRSFDGRDELYIQEELNRRLGGYLVCDFFDPYPEPSYMSDMYSPTYLRCHQRD